MERTTCKFIPHRNNRIRCNREISSSSGFCKRHSNTLQAQSYARSEDSSSAAVGKNPSSGGKLEEKYKKVQIVQNKFGNFEDKESKIVFNKKTR